MFPFYYHNYIFSFYNEAQTEPHIRTLGIIHDEAFPQDSQQKAR